MRNFFTIIILFGLLLLACCSPRLVPISSNLEPLPKGKYGFLPTEGSGYYVPIDTVTALDTLIHRLKGRFPFVQTGKAYFIGYTNDQFSIAARGEAAIPALMHFIKKDADPLGKSGAMYALHLIGINSKVAGREYEVFSNVKARDALRELLQIEELQDQVMELLKRDPWQSDVPYLFEIISRSPADSWPIINCLPRFTIPGIPFHENIPLPVAEIRLKPILKSSISYNRYRDINWKEPYEKQASELIDYLLNLKINTISVDSTLLETKLFGSSFFDLEPGTWSVNGKKDKAGTTTLQRLLDNLTDVGYSNANGTHLQYYIKNDRIYICSTITVKRRLLTWWNNQPQSFKNSFTQNAGPRF